eukprot:m51a1_g2313 hypothetical protein (1309) ;mRNA; f:473643-479426
MVRHQDDSRVRAEGDWPQIFEEDAVELVAPPPDIGAGSPRDVGVIERVGWIEEPDAPPQTPEEEPIEPIGRDNVLVRWTRSRQESVLPASAVRVLDRSFLPGDVVARASDPQGLSGTILECRLYLDLKINVPAAAVRHVHELPSGTWVVKGQWCGQVDSCGVDVDVVLDDGSVIRIGDAAEDTLSPASEDDVADDENFPWYPGQRVIVPRRELQQGEWVRAPPQMKRLRRADAEGTVVRVHPSSAIVHWVTGRSLDPDEVPPEDEVTDTASLVPLRWFSSALWTSGDRAVCPRSVRLAEAEDLKDFSVESLRVCPRSVRLAEAEDLKDFSVESLRSEQQQQQQQAAADAAGEADAGEQEPAQQTHTQRRLQRKRPAKKKDRKHPHRADDMDDGANTALVLCTKTWVTVQWQDASVDPQPVYATELVPLDNVLANDFWPDDFVSTTDGSRTGYVLRVDSGARMCRVHWVEGAQDSEEEELSVYSLKNSDSFDLRIGDIVARVPPQDEQQVAGLPSGLLGACKQLLTALAASLSGQQGAAASPDAQHAVQQTVEQAAEDVVREMSWVGEIVTFESGRIWVMWADGSRELVAPSTLVVLNNEDGNADVDEEEVDDEDAEYEDEPQERAMDQGEASAAVPVEQPRAPIVSVRDTSLQESLNTWGSSRSVWWGASDTGAAQSFASLSALSVAPPTVAERQTEPEAAAAPQPAATSEAPAAAAASAPTATEEAPAAAAAAAGAAAQAEEVKLGSHFEVLEMPGDHYYLNVERRDPSAKYLGRMLKEWDTIKKAGAEGIFVRAYESRVDLLKALIVGPQDTPYADALFVIDIHAPADYPAVPPQAHYVPVGPRLHPNLYEDGYICLSLLGTWAGHKEERWQPETSNILQVVLSVQGLILGAEEPYYLEAGYEVQRGTQHGAHSSRLYTENVTLLALNAIVAYANRPPAPFEDICDAHFASRAEAILKRCESYAQQAEQSDAAPASAPCEAPAPAPGEAAGGAQAGEGEEGRRRLDSSWATKFAAMKKELSDIRGRGARVIRWWIFASSDALPDTCWSGTQFAKLPDKYVDHIEEAFNYAKSIGLLVYPSLMSFDWGKGARHHQEIFTDAAARKSWVVNAVTPIIDRLKSNPAVFAWDLMNEPEWVIDSVDGGDPCDTCTKFRLSAVKALLNDVLAVLRAKGAKQPVSIGSASLKFLSQKKLWNDMSLDFWDFHWYSWATQYFNPLLVQASKAITPSKPVVIGEVMPDPSKDAVLASSANKWCDGKPCTDHGLLVAQLARLGYSGYLPWAWTDPNFVLTPYIGNLFTSFKSVCPSS